MSIITIFLNLFSHQSAIYEGNLKLCRSVDETSIARVVEILAGQKGACRAMLQWCGTLLQWCETLLQ